MRELERDLSHIPSPGAKLATVGAGRMGRALSAALRDAGLPIEGPLGRDLDPTSLLDAEAVLLCVPDAELPAASARVPAGRLVGHCSGARGLAILAPHEAFSLHPLMTVTGAGAVFAGAGAAISGSSSRSLSLARGLAETLGMTPFQVTDENRALYHAAASIASNFLVTLEGAAERLASEVGLERRLLLPLVRATVENWGSEGAAAALTGPVARGDEGTVEAQRQAVASRAPDLLGLFDTMVEATRALAANPAASEPRVVSPAHAIGVG